MTLERKVNLLIGYALVSTTAIMILLFGAFRNDGKQKFTEIDVERINVLKGDGTPQLVISNRARQHPGRMDGKDSAPREREAGMIFFNDEGDECGGLVYSADKKEAGMVLSVDQYKNDQVLQIQYLQEHGNKKPERAYGMKLWDRRDDFPMGLQMRTIDSLKKLGKEAYEKGVAQLIKERKLGEERMFVGRNFSEEVGVFIRDKSGKPRIRLFVDKNNKAHMEMLDEHGRALPLSEYH
ncbi:MAG: hypothetical protein INR69_11725 [Mucilaginibacter polytrichastri]|nr:hypothetical protein [Mucilaginibacter polytrichastri]